ncbi:plant invertase/pectin methylesterase inhibitor superfamily [Actinidia rufa]|uniref:Pectinesterase n=1 Tax=Actinidia rufa TaxID=165716 RepID=A0A7J0DMN9_9ERIC|nr:plant invertase/pectin methylesterase inhibitor superfamily [Actinidia rufa]
MNTPCELQPGLGLATGLGFTQLLVQHPIRSAGQHPRYLVLLNRLVHFLPKSMHLRTEVPAHSHRGEITATNQIESEKRLVLAAAHPSLYSFSKSTLSPSSELLTGHFALVALLVSGQTFAHISKHLPALLYHSKSSRLPGRLVCSAPPPILQGMHVYGTIDFIFGNAAAVFQKCNLLFRRPRPGASFNAILANGRTDPGQHTGFSIHNSKITTASDFSGVKHSFTSEEALKFTVANLIAGTSWLPPTGVAFISGLN